jgi:uncharacterized protein
MVEGTERGKSESTTRGGDDERILSAISYLGLISVIVYLISKDKGSRRVRFHSLQGMLLFGLVMLVDLCLVITILGIILVPFVFLGYLVLVVVMAMKAYQGEEYLLPVIGNIAKKHV